MTDQDREHLIAFCYERFSAAQNADERKRWYARMVEQVRLRSPERVKEMELDMELCA